MDIQEAVTAFSQSEKIKSGLIWVTQVLEFSHGLSEPEKRGAEKTVQVMVSMISRESTLASKLIQDPSWAEVQKHLDLSMVMMNSGVPQEATFHFTRALSQVTSIGQRSLTILKEQGLVK